MTEEQFWIQTWVKIAGVLSTLLLGGLAIWGNVIRAKIVGPKLTIKLLDSLGERINLSDGSEARYYHLRVENLRSSAHANNVRVVLTKVIRAAADGSFPVKSLSGPIQINWQHGHSMPQYPTIGPAINGDLGFIVKDKGFVLSTLFIPNNLDINVLANQKIRVEAMAVSDEAESSPVSIEITWDGQWKEDSKEMSNHMVVREVKST